ncbi:MULTISPECIES: hypothetical protein [Pseudomonas]|uniref:Uncharacterized protein n=1 Tax=Pseudomonas fluorescens LMG 5329 TaxID=1324332 RepID=A0A0A1Z0G0_PSEFL|nr:MULTISPECIES: hypothetical protein [Pseudomonas]KGE66212.1 hypothetical protein K814_0120060 [Pseudomonas fluorescens LMG 5329]NWE02592.1 hypothetical protein [Pseudomonas sp. IPO3749]NWF22356.1 hypothetical protein [Pseudomonas sp. IPO3749]
MLEEDLRGFLEDFDVGGVVDGEPFLAARDMPDEIHGMGGTNSQSTNYEILVITAEAERLGINNPKLIIVAGVSYRVRDRRMIDDGAFSLASLTKV